VICDTCLEAKYVNSPRTFRSRGPCDDCHLTRTCSDIPSSDLELKNPPVRFRYRFRSTVPLPRKPGRYEAKMVNVSYDQKGNLLVTIGPLTPAAT
jgi:hypothetical protein